MLTAMYANDIPTADELDRIAGSLAADGSLTPTTPNASFESCGRWWQGSRWLASASASPTKASTDRAPVARQEMFDRSWE
jgi:hypothetical protein